MDNPFKRARFNQNYGNGYDRTGRNSQGYTPPPYVDDTDEMDGGGGGFQNQYRGGGGGNNYGKNQYNGGGGGGGGGGNNYNNNRKRDYKQNNYGSGGGYQNQGQPRGTFNPNNDYNSYSNGNSTYSANSMGGGQPDDEVANFDLGFKKKIQVKKYKGTIFVDIREYFAKENSNNLLPTKKGVTLTIDMWRKLIALASDVDQVIESMEKGHPVGQIQQNYGHGSSPSTNEEYNESYNYGAASNNQQQIPASRQIPAATKSADSIVGQKRPALQPPDNLEDEEDYNNDDDI